MATPRAKSGDLGHGSGRWRRVVLLGFMGSGKTEVGRALAARLGWAHVDLDLEIERRTGASIEEIFATRGESAFRALEVEITPKIFAADDLVLSPGGGWITNAGLFESLPPDTLTVWLNVSPAEVLRRLARTKDGPVRPLLQSGSPADRVRELLVRREPLYRRAEVRIDTDDRSVREIVDELETIIRGGDAATTKPEA